MDHPDPTPTPPEPDTRRARTIKAAADDAALPSVQIRPEDKTRFRAVAERAGLLHIDAMTLAVELLDRATAHERAETAAERIARIAAAALPHEETAA